MAKAKVTISARQPKHHRHAERISHLDGNSDFYGRVAGVRGLIVEVAGRCVTRAVDLAYLPVIARARRIMATYTDMEGLIRLRRLSGGDERQEAIRLHKPLEGFHGQGKEEATSLAERYRQWVEIVAGSETER